MARGTVVALTPEWSPRSGELLDLPAGFRARRSCPPGCTDSTREHRGGPTSPAASHWPARRCRTSRHLLAAVRGALRHAAAMPGRRPAAAAPAAALAVLVLLAAAGLARCANCGPKAGNAQCAAGECCSIYVSLRPACDASAVPLLVWLCRQMRRCCYLWADVACCLSSLSKTFPVARAAGLLRQGRPLLRARPLLQRRMRGRQPTAGACAVPLPASAILLYTVGPAGRALEPRGPPARLELCGLCRWASPAPVAPALLPLRCPAPPTCMAGVPSLPSSNLRAGNERGIPSMRYTRVFNVRNFGAKGDGIAGEARAAKGSRQDWLPPPALLYQQTCCSAAACAAGGLQQGAARCHAHPLCLPHADDTAAIQRAIEAASEAAAELGSRQCGKRRCPVSASRLAGGLIVAAAGLNRFTWTSFRLLQCAQCAYRLTTAAGATRGQKAR